MGRAVSAIVVAVAVTCAPAASWAQSSDVGEGESGAGTDGEEEGEGETASEPEAASDSVSEPEAASDSASEPETASGSEPASETAPEAGGEAEGDADDGERAERLQAPPPDPARRVAVLLLAARGVEASTADALTEVAIGAVAARGGVTILGKEEFQAQLGQGEARSMECVTSTACLGRVGVELGVDEVVAGTLNKRGATWVFNLNRIDIRSGELVDRVFREVEGDLGEVAAAIQDKVPELYEQDREQPATMLVTANVEGAEVLVDGVLVGIYRGETVRLQDVGPGRHRVTVSAPGHADWSRSVNVGQGSTLRVDASLEGLARERSLSPLLWIGTGVAAVAGATALAFGVKSQDRPPEDSTRAEALAFMDARKRDALVANVSFGVAAAGVATVVLGLVLSDFAPDPERRAQVGLAPVEGGAWLRVEGEL